MKLRLYQTAILISAITLFSKFSGFFRDIYLASVFGTSSDADVFFTAQLIASLLPNILFVVIETVLLPILASYINDQPTHVNRFVNRVYTFSLMILVSFIGLFYLFTPQIVQLIAPDFSYELNNMTVSLTRLLLPMIFFSLLVSLDSVLLRHGQRYLLPEMIGFPMNLMMIGYLVFSAATYGVYGLTIAVVAGAFLQFLLQLISVRKLDVRFRKLDFNFNDEGLKKMGVLVIPVLVGMSIQYVNFFVERILASSLVEGSISALTFGNRLNMFVFGIVSVSIASVFYKSVSDLAAKSDINGLKIMVQRVLGMLVFLLVPATVGMMTLYLPITQMVFERGAFDAAASELTGGVFFWFSLGLIGYAVREMLTRAFYAMQDTKTAMINGGVAVALNAALCVVLTPVMEVNGLALSMSISGLFSAFLLLISLRRKIGALGLRAVVVMSGKVVMASGIMGVVVWWMQGVGLFVSVAVGAVFYVGLVWLMRVRELDVFLGLLKVKLKR